MVQNWLIMQASNILNISIVNMNRGPVTLFLAVIVYLCYLCLGAAIFKLIEGPTELSSVQEMRELHFNFLRDHRCVNDDDLEALIVKIVEASNRGVSAVRNATGELNWSFGQAFFFSGTVITTVGYGHVTPLSKEGKSFCILYAMFGIPFTLVLLSAFVERLLVPTIWLLQWLNKKLGHLYTTFNIRLLHLIMILTILIVMFMLVPAGIFAYIEPGWDYLDSFYYCFISLTTVGLGDYIPGDTPNQPYRSVYKAFITGYLLVGITVMMLTLAVFYDIPQLNIGSLFSQRDEANTEKMRLAGSGFGLNYGIDTDVTADLQNNHRQVVRVRSRQRDESPSPEEPGPKEIRVP